MGIGRASGENRAEDAAKQVVKLIYDAKIL